MPTSLDVREHPRQEPEIDESLPLLDRPKTKPFYRPRPLWLVPFAVIASLVRGMTIAPRVEVLTQLSCNRLHGGHQWDHTQPVQQLHQLHTALYSSIDPLGPHFVPTTLFSTSQTLTNVVHQSTTRLPIVTRSRFEEDDDDDADRRDSDDTEDPRRLPSARCQADPEVTAGTARLQTILTTTSGLLCSLTTGWWGHFGDRHGRTRVLAITTFGLFFTDLIFILVATPNSPLSEHGHKLLLAAPVIEGLVGGWSTLQSGISAYLSDCTSPGSRAHIFSRFQGVVYIGFTIGPMLGGWLIKHPFGPGIDASSGQNVTTVFWVAVACSFFNLLMMAFVFPESLNNKKIKRAAEEEYIRKVMAKGKVTVIDVPLVPGADAGPSGRPIAESFGETEIMTGLFTFTRLLSPLAVFLPVAALNSSPSSLGSRKRRDWSLTMLSLALFGFMLSTGIWQIKYLYATHTYGWGAEQLSYYISFMGVGRVFWLLCGLPVFINFFKPKPVVTDSSGNVTGSDSTTVQGAAPTKGKKPKPTRAQLGQEISFDLLLARFSILVDVMSHTLVAIFPSPSYIAHMQPTLNALATAGDAAFNRSQALFIFATSLNGMGSGTIPSINSLALCMLQVRRLNGQTRIDEEDTEEEGTGALFGAFAVLNAVGQMILGPLLFGVVYSSTVATFPKAIFLLAAGIMVFALTMLMCVRNPVRVPPAGRGGTTVQRKRRERGDAERGRSRISKDLRGGAIRHNSSSTYGSTESC